MVLRTIFLIAVTALVIAGFVFMAPLDVLLSARGYTPDQIATVKQAVAPDTDAGDTSNTLPGSTNSASDAPANVTSNTDSPAPEPLAATGSQDSATATDSKPNIGTQKQPASDATQPQEVPAPTERKFVSTDTINVRAGQGTDTEVVGQFGPGTIVTVLEDPEGDWMKVEGDSTTGWVYKPLFERQE